MEQKTNNFCNNKTYLIEGCAPLTPFYGGFIHYYYIFISKYDCFVCNRISMTF